MRLEGRSPITESEQWALEATSDERDEHRQRGEKENILKQTRDLRRQSPAHKGPHSTIFSKKNLARVQTAPGVQFKWHPHLCTCY